MTLQSIGPEGLMTCPLDESHRIIKKRMQFHLVRCLKNHTSQKKLRCPWNVLHFVDHFEYLDHCRECDNLSNVMGSTIISEDDANGDVASVPISVVNAAAPAMDEDWDATPCYGTYDPLKQLESRPILRGSIGLSKARKRQFKQQERKRHQQMEDFLPIRTEPNPVEEPKPRRTPHTLPLAMSAVASNLEDKNSVKASDEFEKSAKWPQTLRRPHARCPGLSYETINDSEFEMSKSDRNNVTLFDSQYDAAENTSATSSSIRYTNPEAMLKFVAASKASKRNNVSEDVPSGQKSFDASRTMSYKAAVSPSNCETVDELTQQLANLETAQKSIDEKKAAILQQISQYGRKNADAESNVIIPQDENSSGNRQFNRKCAANLGKPVTLKNSPILGVAHCMSMAAKALKDAEAPGSRGKQPNNEILGIDSKENINPSTTKTTRQEIANPFKKTAEMDIDSIFGNERTK